MRKFVASIIVIALFFSLIPLSALAAANPTYISDIVSGKTYSGILDKEPSGWNIPASYGLKLAKNSIVRIVVNTNANADISVELESKDSPNYSTEEGSVAYIHGSSLTAVNAFGTSGPTCFYSSNFYVTADKRNTQPNTELFGNLRSGVYSLRVSSATMSDAPIEYSFTVTITPMKYSDDNEPNDTMATAQKYTLSSYQQGNMMENGVVDHKFLTDAMDMYSVTLPAGKYTFNITTDGFLAGTAAIMDASQFIAGDSSILNFYTRDEHFLASTFEQHQKYGKTFSETFQIKKAGKYYILVQKQNYTAGSYRFRLTPVQTLASLYVPAKTITLAKGKTAANKVYAVYSTGSKTDITKLVTLSSSNKKVAAIQSKYIVKAVGKGKATITVSYGGKKASYTVTVK